MKHTMRTLTSFDLKLQEARERLSMSPPQNPDGTLVGEGVLIDENGELVQKPVVTFRSQEHFQEHVERLYNSDKKQQHKGQNYSRMNSCEMCMSGTREHNHPEKPFSSTLFKIKPIGCKHRLLNKKFVPVGKMSPIKPASTVSKTARVSSTVKKQPKVNRLIVNKVLCCSNSKQSKSARKKKLCLSSAKESQEEQATIEEENDATCRESQNFPTIFSDDRED